LTNPKSKTKISAKSPVKSPAKKAVLEKPLSKKSTKPKSAASKPAAKAYKLKIGDSAPGFSLASTSGKTTALKDFSGRYIVFYFYPKDNTPGCTLEGQDFKKLYGAFQKLGCDIVGVSKDSLKSHEGFKKKFSFPFELLVDEDGALCSAFDVIQLKKLYGREFMGIERSTFLVGPKGKILGEWRKLKVDGHAQAVLDLLKQQAKG
jgi:thioredoxin-dependent peroxiredoxin